MRKKILDALKAKYEGVSEKVLDRTAKQLAKTVTDEEEVTTAVEGITFQQVLESYGDSRGTEASKTASAKAVQDYEAKYGLKDGKLVESEDDDEDDDADPEPTPSLGRERRPTTRLHGRKH